MILSREWLPQPSIGVISDLEFPFGPIAHLLTDKSDVELSLFICGDALPGLHAAARVQQWATAFQWSVQIIDVLLRPDVAEERRILATPTLIKEQPLPSRRVIGDLRDEERVFNALLLRPTIRSEP